MDGYFEDAGSIDYSLTQKYPFYCFTNSSWQNQYPMAAHWHFFVEILYITEGHGRVIVNGTILDLYKSDILFLFPRDVHSLDTIGREPFEYVVIKLDPAMIYDDPKDLFMFRHFRQLLAPLPPELQKLQHLPGYDHRELKEIHDLFINRPYQFDWLAKGLLFRFFHAYSIYLHDHGFTIGVDSDSDSSIEGIAPAFGYIHDNFTSPINAAKVAEHCHLSYSYFSRHFKKVTGISFTQYLNFIRITEAEKLLLEGNPSVTTVGYKVGFSDTSYFIRQFKNYKKMTPKKYLMLVKGDF